ncbi:MAG: DUF898 domain-containing protein [Candidatus Devosia symbiotica]|nr:DUF898 domain-containing protein [Candidatus Devosia symbiotica]
MLLRAYVLPTVGLYRFWLLIWKCRFYWANTEINGDSLEYTGNAMQLLVGFLMALAVFLPLYAIFNSTFRSNRPKPPLPAMAQSQSRCDFWPVTPSTAAATAASRAPFGGVFALIRQAMARPMLCAASARAW